MKTADACWVGWLIWSRNQGKETEAEWIFQYKLDDDSFIFFILLGEKVGPICSLDCYWHWRHGPVFIPKALWWNIFPELSCIWRGIMWPVILGNSDRTLNLFTLRQVEDGYRSGILICWCGILNEPHELHKFTENTNSSFSLALSNQTE